MMRAILQSAAAGLYFQAWVRYVFAQNLVYFSPHDLLNSQDLESCGGNSIQVTFESAGCADFSGTSWNDITSCWFISNGLTCTLYEYVVTSIPYTLIVHP